jgi:amidase
VTSASGGLTALTATAQAAMIAAGDVSATEVLDAHLARIADHNPELNAVVVLDEGAARGAAGAADEAHAAGRPPGPLAGVPVTVKEAFDVAGLPTTAGMPEYAGRLASTDAPAVRLLRDAGAVILGKTNVPTQLADLQCANPLYGRTVNPWDHSRSCGGSSGGSAASVAASLAAADLCSDLSGSIRVPASWCGVYGLRPSHGLISKRGHLPWPTDGLLEPATSAVGLLARSVEDLSLVFEVLAGGERPAPAARPLRPAPLGPLAPDSLRIAVWSGVPDAPVDRETSCAFAAAVSALDGAGVVIEELAPPIDPAGALALAWRLVDAEITHGLTSGQWEDVRGGGSGMTQLVHDHLVDQEARLQATRAWQEVFERFDAVLCPAAAVPAQPVDERPPVRRPLVIDGVEHPHPVLAHWSLLTSVAHLPSVTLPAGVGATSGLPVGAQLVGGHLDDLTLLAVAGVVAEVLRAYRPPPGTDRRSGPTDRRPAPIARRPGN